MAETKKSNEMKKVKIIAKNSSKAKMIGDKRMIKVGYNHEKFMFVEGEEVELPSGCVQMLKEHKTKKIVPSGKSAVRGKNFKTEIYKTYEVIEL